MYRFFRVDHYLYSKAAEQVYSFGFDWCFSYLGKKVIRLTRDNQAVDFFFFRRHILKVQLPRKSKNVKVQLPRKSRNVKHLVLCHLFPLP